MALTPEQQRIIAGIRKEAVQMEKQVMKHHATYGWIVQKDHGGAVQGLDLPSRIGWVGPRNIDPAIEKRLRAGEGKRWLTKSADGDKGYEGLWIGEEKGDDMFGPLEDLSKPDIGDISIFYFENGKWVEL